MTVDLQLLGNALLALSAPGGIAFTLLYGLRSAWRATHAGRALFWLSASLSGILTLYALAVLWGPDYAFREEARFLLSITVLINIYRMLWVLLRAQRRDRSRLLTAAPPPNRKDSQNG